MNLEKKQKIKQVIKQFKTFYYIIILAITIHLTWTTTQKCIYAQQIPKQVGEASESQLSTSVTLEDGEYAIDLTMSGGSGKATIDSPTLLVIKDQKAYANLTFSSSNYDYMIVGDEKYLNQSEEGMNSTFEIPVEDFDRDVEVIADTLAMGTPHEITYQLHFYSDSIQSKSALPQEAAKRVLIMAAIIIVVGGILNAWVKKRRKSS